MAIIPQRYDDLGTVNAVRLLSHITSYNGYIQLYTEIDSHVEEGDIIFITYSGTTDEIDSDSAILDNLLLLEISDEFIYTQYIQGYTVIYVDKNNNSFAINRHLLSIPPNSKIYNHYISKIVCHGMTEIKSGTIDSSLFKNAYVNVNGNFDDVKLYQGVFFNGDIYNLTIRDKYEINYISLYVNYNEITSKIFKYRNLNNNDYGYSYFYNLDSSLQNNQIESGNYENCKITTAISTLQINGGFFKNCLIDNYTINDGYYDNILLSNNCTWNNGRWTNGTFLLNTWNGGFFINGQFGDETHEPIWNNGIFKNGVWYGKYWNNGDFKGGKWVDRIIYNPNIIMKPNIVLSLTGLTTINNGNFFNGTIYGGNFNGGNFRNGESINTFFNNVNIFGGKITSPFAILNSIIYYSKIDENKIFSVSLKSNDKNLSPIANCTIYDGIFNGKNFTNNVIQNGIYKKCNIFQNIINNGKFEYSYFKGDSQINNLEYAKYCDFQIQQNSLSYGIYKKYKVKNLTTIEDLSGIEFPYGHDFENNNDSNKNVYLYGERISLNTNGVNDIFGLSGITISANTYRNIYNNTFLFGNTNNNLILKYPPFNTVIDNNGKPVVVYMLNTDKIKTNKIVINGGKYDNCNLYDVTINDGTYNQCNMMSGCTVNFCTFNGNNFYTKYGEALQNTWNNGIFNNGVFGYNLFNNNYGYQHLKLWNNNTSFRTGNTFKTLTPSQSYQLVEIYPVTIRKNIGSNTYSTNTNNNILQTLEAINEEEIINGINNPNGIELLGLQKWETDIQYGYGIGWKADYTDTGATTNYDEFIYDESGNILTDTTKYPWRYPVKSKSNIVIDGFIYDRKPVPYQLVFKIKCANIEYYNNMKLYIDNIINVNLFNIFTNKDYSELYMNYQLIDKQMVSINNNYYALIVLEFPYIKKLYNYSSTLIRNAYDMFYKNVWSDANAGYITNLLPTLNYNNTNNVETYSGLWGTEEKETKTSDYSSNYWIKGCPPPPWWLTKEGFIEMDTDTPEIVFGENDDITKGYLYGITYPYSILNTELLTKSFKYIEHYSDSNDYISLRRGVSIKLIKGETIKKGLTYSEFTNYILTEHYAQSIYDCERSYHLTFSKSQPEGSPISANLYDGHDLWNQIVGLTTTAKYKPLEMILYLAQVLIYNNPEGSMLDMLKYLMNNLINATDYMLNFKNKEGNYTYNSGKFAINFKAIYNYIDIFKNVNKLIKTNTSYFESSCRLELKFKNVSSDINLFRDKWYNGDFYNGTFQGQWYNGNWYNGNWYGINFLNVDISQSASTISESPKYFKENVDNNYIMDISVIKNRGEYYEIAPWDNITQKANNIITNKLSNDDLKK
jgi:hypothetical protein